VAIAGDAPFGARVALLSFNDILGIVATNGNWVTGAAADASGEV
jgi:hypothetical protein